MLKQRLTQKQIQKLSPQQIQLMKMLQIPTANLEQRIKEELEANPALEMENNALTETEPEAWDEEKTEESKEENQDLNDDLDLSEYLRDDDIADYKLKSYNYSPDDEEKSIPIRVTRTFHENLMQQLGMLNLNERQRKIAEQIIGSISNDGYLHRDLLSIEDDLAFSQNIMAKPGELEEILEIVQSLDPPGVGARDLRECLILQLERKHQTKAVKTALEILEKHFDAFAKKHYEKLQKNLKISEDELKEALDEILKLNPKPGGAAAESSRNNQYIVPDFIITNNDGQLELTLNNRNAPDLRVSPAFRDMLEQYSKTKKPGKKQKEAIMFIKQKIDSAKWFIDAIRQRQQTLYKTMHAIMVYQYDFFLTGDETLIKPMILKDIADKIGMDISTVSRVANSKYVQTEFGTFPLKYFFSESLTTDSGEEVSTREVKKILTTLIENEDKRKPLSDQKLMEELQKKGYHIARRTVAKYREQLNIPVARLRKQL